MAQTSAIRSAVPLRLGAVRESIVDRLERVLGKSTMRTRLAAISTTRSPSPSVKNLPSGGSLPANGWPALA